jgi:hypothetical protein
LRTRSSFSVKVTSALAGEDSLMGEVDMIVGVVGALDVG